MKKQSNKGLVKRAREILSNISFGMFGVRHEFLVYSGHGGVYMRACFVGEDTYSGVPEMQYTRKWLLSPQMTDSEIVQTAFKCCMTSVEHEARESFKYLGRRIFGPHFDVDDLWKLCGARENAGGRHK